MEITNLVSQSECIEQLDIKPDNINIIIFPDWTEPEEALYLELEKVLIFVLHHPHSQQITLFVETGHLHEDDVNLFLSGIVMNLLVTENFDISHECEISLVTNLDGQQWSLFLSHLHGRIILEYQNQAALAGLFLEKIPSYKIDDFNLIPLQLLILGLANRLFVEGIWQRAIAQYRKFLDFHPGDADIHQRLSDCYRNLNLLDEYFATLRAGIELYPTAGHLHFKLIIDLRRYGHIQAAIVCAENACQLLPDDYTFKILKYLTVPSIYDRPEEIKFYRHYFTQGLENLIQQTSLTSPQEKNNALRGIASLTNFHLSYQAQNDRELQSQYGKLVHKIMAANFPEWVKPLYLAKIQPGQKIRIGYLSYYLHSYSGTLWLIGWLRYCDRQNFEIYCYYVGNSPDAVTQQFQDYSHVFHHIPHDLPSVCQQIISDDLHILVFPEIGMDPQTMQIAGLRLAPIQCTAWGHPVTSGLPTVDYFLSSELMEPENAQTHYSEKLIFLPNIGVSYPKPYIPPICKTRTDFQLPDDAVIYLCCQAPFKYLPQYDFILPEIALLVTKAKFVFLRGEPLQNRIQRAFSTVGLDSQDYCLFLSIPERLDYLMINLLSDVYLDTFTWSGGNTSLEAIACNLPIVTCPGEFMRGRHSESFLKMLRVTDTIAHNEAEYIQVAVKLGLDPIWRSNIAQQMSQNQDLLFDDQACVKGLEAFYKKVVGFC